MPRQAHRARMSKKALTETDIRSKFITPALVGVNGGKWNLHTQFPSPAELWSRYRAAKGFTPEQEVVATQDSYDYGTRRTPRYYQQIAINRTVDTIARCRAS